MRHGPKLFFLFLFESKHMSRCDERIAGALPTMLKRSLPVTFPLFGTGLCDQLLRDVN
jgi:hypothetical protein